MLVKREKCAFTSPRYCNLLRLVYDPSYNHGPSTKTCLTLSVRRSFNFLRIGNRA